MKLTGIFLILFAIIVAGCGESQPDAPQVETEASNEVQQYTDAPTAVSEGRRFLDIGETEKAIADRPGLAALIAIGVGVAAGALIQALVRRH